MNTVQLELKSGVDVEFGEDRVSEVEFSPHSVQIGLMSPSNATGDEWLPQAIKDSGCELTIGEYHSYIRLTDGDYKFITVK